MGTGTFRGRVFVFGAYMALCYYLTAALGSSMNTAGTSLENAFGWSFADIATIISLGNVLNVIVGFLAGHYCSRHSAKRAGVALGVLFAVCVFGIGFADSLPAFAVFYVIANSAGAAWGYNVNPILLAKWFPRQKGMILGVSSIGIPVAAGTAPIIYLYASELLGAAPAFSVFAVVSVFACAALALVSASVGRSVGSAEAAAESATSSDGPSPASEAAPRSLTRVDVIRDRDAWVLAISLGVQFLYCSGLSVQVVPMLSSFGIGTRVATLLMLLVAGGSIVGSTVCGMIDTKFGARRATVLAYVLAIFSMLLMATGNGVCATISLLPISFCMGGCDNWPMSLCIEHYRTEDFSTAYGLIFPVVQLVGAGGAAFFASLMQLTGSYQVPCLLMAGMLAVTMAVFSKRFLRAVDW